MRFRYLLVSILGAALAFACGSEGPLITVNQRMMLSQGDVRQTINPGSCYTSRVRRDETLGPEGLTYVKPNSSWPDLEVAMAFHREYLLVAARTTGTGHEVGKALSLDFLMSHSHDTLIVNRARATDGAHEVETWGGDCAIK